MKVTCSRCGTEYNFDDAKVTDDGVKVKCTRCENVFRVRKKAFAITEPASQAGAASPSETPPPEIEPVGEPSQPSLPPEVPQGADGGAGAGAGAAARTWMIRKPTGAILEFGEMTTLQRWIVERRVAPEDEISHNGVKWKRLGTIPELGPFFEVVSKAVTAPELPEETRASTPPPKPAPVPAAGRDARGRASRADSRPVRRGRAGTYFGFAALLLVGAAGWAELTPAGQETSAPLREWLFVTAGLDLRASPSGTATPVAVASPSPEPVATGTALVDASPEPGASPSPEPSPSAEPTAVAVAVAVATAKPTAARTATPALGADVLLQQGYEAYSRGRYREAIQKYQGAVNAAPDNSEAYALLGLAYLDAGQDDLAESSLEAAIRLNPRFADAHRYLGMLYARRNDKTRAVTSFNTYLDLRPNGPTSDDVRKRVASLQGG